MPNHGRSRVSRDLGSGLYPHAVPVGAHREPLGGVTWAVRADSHNLRDHRCIAKAV